jgi:hypothetical protein
MLRHAARRQTYISRPEVFKSIERQLHPALISSETIATAHAVISFLLSLQGRPASRSHDESDHAEQRRGM